MNMPRMMLVTISLIIVASLMASCSASFRAKDLGKSTIDFVADAHYQETQRLLIDLTRKLYLRNPAELRKTPGMSIDTRKKQIFDPSGRVIFAELGFLEGTEALELALNPGFLGDRVLALMAGLNGMIRNAYEYRQESYMFDKFDEQKLYDSARNIEILVWRLSRLNKQTLRPLLLTNSLPGEPDNLSFERRFGKLIALQDVMANIISQRNDRIIVKVTHNLARVAFFPL